jgi:4-amino-4-deoxy-L-arabinose transferase-like glycosyltransferase
MNKSIAIGVFMVAILGFLIILLTTRWGIGASPDSVVYIGGARNLAAGHGFTMDTVAGNADPITHFAPFYSWVLSLSGFLAVDPIAGARWINALLFGLNIFLVGLLVAKSDISGRSTIVWLPLLASLLLLSAPTMLEIHVMAWTEPLFLFLGFTGLFVLAVYLQRFELRYLILSAILISLAFLSRYAGAALIATAILALILFGSQSFPKRIKAAGLFAFISLLPAMLWMWRNMQSAGTATSREFSFHPIGLTKIREAITTISSWALVPASASTWVKVIPIVLFVLVFSYLIFSKKNQAGHDENKRGAALLPVMVRLLGAFSLIYLAFLVFSISFIDANTPLDVRILSPLYLSGIVLVLYFVDEFLARFPKSPILKTAMIFAAVFVFASNIWTGSALVLQGYDQGIGFNSLAWSRSGILAEVEMLPRDVVIYTNAPEAVYFFFDRAALSIPRKFESVRQQPNPNYLADLAKMCSSVENEKGVVLYFFSLNRPTLVSEEELIKYMPLQVVIKTDDGTMYAVNNCG